MIPKRDKNSDISREIAAGKELKEKILNLAQEAANNFLKGDNLNSAVADIAVREGFNRLQIQRLIEEANTVAYNKKYDTVKKENDRRLNYEIAEMQKVLDVMGESAPDVIDNPNEIKGRPGVGEMDKAASCNETTIHTPHKNTALLREKVASKLNVRNEKEKTNRVNKLSKTYASDVFKIANALVMSERLYKNASEILNTLSSDVDLITEIREDIEKKASEIIGHMKLTKKVHPDFNIDFSLVEKKANFLLGEYSLLKTANSEKVDQVKVAPTQHVYSYESLIKIANAIQADLKELETLFEKE